MATQRTFAAALFDADRAIPEAIARPEGKRVDARFAVYRNNVIVGLTDALQTRFPVTCRLVGEDFFSAMARVYLTGEPPRSPVLVIFGDTFPDFIAGFEHAQDMPWLADVTRLEALRTRAYHAADAEPLQAEDFAALDPASLADLRLALHPSVHLLRSPWPAYAIWSANCAEDAGEVAEWQAQDVLVSRCDDVVAVRRLATGQANFLDALHAGATLGDAVAATCNAHPDFDPGAALALLISAGLATSNDISTAQGDRP